MRSVFLRPTGKVDDQGRDIKEPVFLKSSQTAGKSIWVNADPNNGVDSRLNAAATTAEQATGYQILMDSMTYIKQQESTQVYYELQGPNGQRTPRDIVPIAVGDGGWAGSILTRRVFQNAGDFEAGLVRQGAHNARNTNSDVSMDSVTLPTFIWEDGVEYNLAEIEQALVASNWDIIAAKHKSRMKKFQLGIQKIVHLGTASGSMEGLLNNTKVNINTTFITKSIKTMTAAELQTFVAGLMAAYWSNSNSTRLPTRFEIPMTDYLGLGALVPVAGGVTTKTVLQYLTEAFEMFCGKGFTIAGNAYCDAANSGAMNKNTYALYRHDAEALRMDIPVDFTVTQPNSIDNFHFMDVAYAQLTGVGFYMPLETYLFQY